MRHAIIYFLVAFSQIGFGQCEDGFSNSVLNGKKVKLPCISYIQAQGLTLLIKQNPISNADSIFIDIVFHNPTDSIKTIYWYDFVESSGVPLSFSFTVNDSAGKAICTKLNWGHYMDNSVFYSKKRRNDKINILAGQTFAKTIKLWWPSMSSGQYIIKLFYGESDLEISSNDFTVKFK